MGILNKKIFAGFALFFILILSIFFIISGNILAPNVIDAISDTIQGSTNISPVQCVKDSDCIKFKKCTNEYNYNNWTCNNGMCKPLISAGGAPCSETEGPAQEKILFCPNESITCDGASLFCKNKTGIEILYKKCSYGCKTLNNQKVCCSGTENTVLPGTCIRSVEPLRGSCEEVIPNYNNLSESRINIIFVGFNYANMDPFKFFVEGAIDYDSNNYGLLSIEPFKSNKDKFNFWYINGMQKSVDKEDLTKKMENLSYICNYTNLQGVAVSNLNIGGFAFMESNLSFISMIDKKINSESLPQDCSIKDMDLNNDSCITQEDGIPALCLNCPPSCFSLFSGCPGQFDSLPENLLDLYYKNYFGVFVHEFGHAFGKLEDEYVISGNKNELIGGEKNCFGASSKDGCLENAPWKDLIGKGCGNESIIDCTLEDKNYSYEIGCFEGCDYRYTGNYRSTLISIMGGANNSGLDTFITNPYSFRLVNEKLLCEKITKDTGSSGGYCDKFDLSPLNADSADLGSDVPNESLEINLSNGSFGDSENASISPETDTPKSNSLFNALKSFFRSIFGN